MATNTINAVTDTTYSGSIDTKIIVQLHKEEKRYYQKAFCATYRGSPEDYANAIEDAQAIGAIANNFVNSQSKEADAPTNKTVCEKNKVLRKALDTQMLELRERIAGLDEFICPAPAAKFLTHNMDTMTSQSDGIHTVKCISLDIT